MPKDLRRGITLSVTRSVYRRIESLAASKTTPGNRIGVATLCREWVMDGLRRAEKEAKVFTDGTE